MPKFSNGLGKKQKRFVEEYLIDLNATQAALRAGYAPKTAFIIGHENLRKPNIAKAIEKAQAKRSARTEISQDRVLLEYSRLAFLDSRKFFTPSGHLKNIVELDDDSAACIAGMDIVYKPSPDGDEPMEIRKIKLTDKKGALDSVAKHLGMFKADNEQKNLAILQGLIAALPAPLKEAIQKKVMESKEDSNDA